MFGHGLVDCQPATGGIFAGLGKCLHQQLGLLAVQRFFQLAAFFGQPQLLHPLVVGGGAGGDQAHFHQLPQGNVDGLLGDIQIAQQVFHRQPRVQCHKEQDAVMHARQAAFGQHFVRLVGKGEIGVKEGFHRVAQQGVGEWRLHVDVCVNRS